MSQCKQCEETLPIEKRAGGRTQEFCNRTCRVAWYARDKGALRDSAKMDRQAVSSGLCYMCREGSATISDGAGGKICAVCNERLVSVRARQLRNEGYRPRGDSK